MITLEQNHLTLAAILIPALLFAAYGFGWTRGFSKAADQLKAFRAQHLAPRDSDPPWMQR